MGEVHGNGIGGGGLWMDFVRGDLMGMFMGVLIVE